MAGNGDHRCDGEWSARETELLLRTSEAMAQLGSWRLDLGRNEVLWSDEVFRILGLEPGSVRPSVEAFQARVHPDDRERVAAAYSRALEQATTFDLTFRVERPDGSIRHVRAKSEELRDGTGRVLTSLGMIQDVTEQRMREDVLAARLRLLQRAADEPLEQLLRSTLDEAELLTGSCIGFYHFLDEDQQTLSLQTWSSNTLQHMCTAEGAGQHYPVAKAGVWVDCIREQKPVVHNDYAALAHKRGLPAGHAPVRRELVVPVIRGGLIRAILGVGNKPTPYHDGDVTTTALLADLAWDIAERKRTQQDRLQLERRLLQGQKLESLGVLAGGVAHDFNNLLQVITGNLQLLALADLSPEAREGVDKAQAATRRAADLTRQMLAYSGRGSLATRPLRLDSVLREQAELCRVAVPRKQLLRFDLRAGDAVIRVDPGQLQQLVTNLLTNAAEAIGDGDGTVTVRTGTVELAGELLAGCRNEARAQPGAHAFLEIVDTGAGMEPATLERLFDPFFSTKFVGRGLGMPAVLGIVRGHQGAIAVSSRPGAGTTVRVYLPQATAPAAAGAAAPPTTAMAPAGAVLVVDDEVAVRHVCAAYLRRLGYEPVLAASGDEAVEICRRDPAAFVAVVTDLTMPGRDGVATALALKDLRADLPIVLSSGYPEQAAAARRTSTHHDGFLAKPYELEDLRTALQRVLTAAPAARRASGRELDFGG